MIKFYIENIQAKPVMWEEKKKDEKNEKTLILSYDNGSCIIIGRMRKYRKEVVWNMVNDN